MAFVKNIVILMLLIGIVMAGIFFAAREDVAYINVQINLTELENGTPPRVDNLTAILVPVTKVSEPKGTGLYLPGLVVLPLQNGEMIGPWTSVPYTGNGTYNIKAGLVKYPKKGEFVLINLRFIAANGIEMYSLTYSTELE